VVRHDVVQLAGDRGALGRAGGAFLRFPAPLLLGRPLLGLPAQFPCRTDDQAEQQRNADRDGQPEHRRGHLAPRVADDVGQSHRGEQSGGEPHGPRARCPHGHLQQHPAGADRVDRRVVDRQDRDEQQPGLDEQADQRMAMEGQGAAERGDRQRHLHARRPVPGMHAEHQVPDAAEIEQHHPYEGVPRIEQPADPPHEISLGAAAPGPAPARAPPSAPSDG
jgi:hypothetical protein